MRWHTTIMRDIETLTPQFKALVANWNSEAQVKSVKQIAGDMSPRRYFRLETSDSKGMSTAVAMVFDSRAVPEAGGKSDIDSFDAVVLLTDYLLKWNLPVPKIYALSDEDSLIIEEDFGDTFLADFLAANRSAGVEQYRSAIDLQIKLQQNPPDRDFFAFKRSFTRESYIHEMQEIRDFYLIWKVGAGKVSAEDAEEFDSDFEWIAEKLLNQPQTLALRDYHSWNLMVKNQREIGVIDFQDALLATRCYDVVSLLNDRDTDSLLGEKTYADLLEYFFSSHPKGDELRKEYPLVLLQRDLKVAGRLAKMVVNRGLTRYEKWIGGTARRVRRTIEAAGEKRLDVLLQRLIKIDPTFGK